MIEQKTAEEFQPDDYKDEVRERQLELIQQKIDGEQITVAPSAEPQAQIIDLMAALKASIAGEGGGEGEGVGPSRSGRSLRAEIRYREDVTRDVAHGHSGMTRFRYWSNKGTVKAVSPCAGL